LINSEKAITSPVFEGNVEILVLTVFNNSHPRPEKYGATIVYVFGSYVRGTEKPGIDIDFLVEFAERKACKLCYRQINSI
jgi:predicted nucleotidyltransferase